MKTLEELTAAVTELARYGCAGFHGRLELAPTETPLTLASVTKLKSLGWQQTTRHYDRKLPWFIEIKE